MLHPKKSDACNEGKPHMGEMREIGGKSDACNEGKPHMGEMREIGGKSHIEEIFPIM